MEKKKDQLSSGFSTDQKNVESWAKGSFQNVIHGQVAIKI